MIRHNSAGLTATLWRRGNLQAHVGAGRACTIWSLARPRAKHRHTQAATKPIRECVSERGRTSASEFRPWSVPSVPLETVRKSAAPLPPAQVLSANVLPVRSP